ncbi:hypothetical protein ONZ45_g12705 [Pleurotus djamor]|nr:hypothetical protein ONZ45_g12705 [Pleurotus djamor]
MQTRKFFSNEPTARIPYGDPKKVVEKVYEASRLEEPPMWLPLGKDSVKMILAQVLDLEKVVRQYEGWSDDLLLE